MTAEKIFYADPHNHVIVTENVFVVNNKEYRIFRIRDYFVRVVRPILLPGISAATAGVFLVITGSLRLVSFHFVPVANIVGVPITGFGWTVLAGIALMLLGVLMVWASKPHYALHISAWDEEADVIVTSKKDYLTRITDALNHAFVQRRKKSSR